MKKKIIFTFIAILATTHTAFAEIQLGENTSLFFNTFFVQLKDEKFQEAYENQTNSQFQETTSLETFIIMMKETGLTKIKKQEWLEVKKEMMGQILKIKANIIDEKNITHELVFELINANHELKIKSILETISLQNFRKRLPKSADIHPVVKKDIEFIISLMNTGDYKNIYANFSSSAQRRISKTKAMKALRSYKKLKINLNPAENTEIKLNKLYPTLLPDARMLIRGHYTNKDSKKIKYTLYYDYEWHWKLGGFEFSVGA